MKTGEQLRDEGAELVLNNDVDEWKVRAGDAVRDLAKSLNPFTAEEVRDRAGDPPNPNLMGAVILKASRAGLIVKAGYAKATRPERHANDNRLWIGVP